MHSFKSILFWDFLQLSHFHTGESNIIYPREPIMGKKDLSNFKIEWDKGFSVPGAFKQDHLQPIKLILFLNFFQIFHFHTGRPILITPEGK